MKENDLRVGNLVYVEGEIHKIEGVVTRQKKSIDDNITNFHIYTSFQRSYVDFENISSIPLTYRILKKFGFIDPAENGMGVRRNIDSFNEICMYVQGNQLRFQSQKGGFTVEINHIDSVHKLQNLWYFYTGKELEYTLVK